MSCKYTITFTAGGRVNGAKIGQTERIAMHEYLIGFKEKYPTAEIFEYLGMAHITLTDEEKLILESDYNIYTITEYKQFRLVSTLQTNSPWHLSNISKNLYGNYEYTTTGKDIAVYIVDSGIDITNPEFEGRAISGYFLNTPINPHGTHVAGLVGSKTYGVAKECTLIDVQVFPGDSEESENLFEGIDWILANHTPDKPGIVNMSLGGPADFPNSIPESNIIRALIVDGLIVVVAAGNETVDVNTVWPAGITDVITVGAINNTNIIANFSNYGPGVDIFAPGVDVTSTILGHVTDAYNGTSMATPIVSGVIAKYLELCPGITHSEVQNNIKYFGIDDVTSLPNTTTLRIYSELDGKKDSRQTTLSKHLYGEYRTVDVDNTKGSYTIYTEVDRLLVLRRYSTVSYMSLASEIVTIEDVIVPPPTVLSPELLPPNVLYDGSYIVFNAGFSIVYRGNVYQATTIVDNLYTYDVADILYMTLLVEPNNVYSITTTSRLCYYITPIAYDDGYILFNPDYTITYLGIVYAPTLHLNALYEYNYPGVVVVSRNGAVIETITQLATGVVVEPGDTILYSTGYIVYNEDLTITYNDIIYSYTNYENNVYTYSNIGVTIDSGVLTSSNFEGTPIVIPNNSNAQDSYILLQNLAAQTMTQLTDMLAQQSALLGEIDTLSDDLSAALTQKENATTPEEIAVAQTAIDSARQDLNTANTIMSVLKDNILATTIRLTNATDAANGAAAQAKINAQAAAQAAAAQAAQAHIDALAAQAAAQAAQAAAQAAIGTAQHQALQEAANNLGEAAQAAAALEIAASSNSAILDAAYNAAVIAAANAVAQAQAAQANAATANAAAQTAAAAATTATTATIANIVETKLAIATAINQTIATNATATALAATTRIQAAKAAANTSITAPPASPASPVTQVPTAKTRTLGIDFAGPAEVSTYNLNLQKVSGSFSYSGATTITGICKSAITFCGYNGIIERVSKNAARNSAPHTIEGRILPTFTTEFIYINKVEQTNGTPYETKDVVIDVAAQAGITVAFSATSTKLRSFTYAGKAIDALSQLAEMSCGELLQQNGSWFIQPRYIAKGAYTISQSDIISCGSSIQSDISDMCISFLGNLKEAILARDQVQREIDRLQNLIYNISSLEQLPTDPIPKDTEFSSVYWQQMGGVNFSFGWNGKSMVMLNENIAVDSLNWKEFEETENTSEKFFKVEVVRTKTDNNKTIVTKRGLTSLDRTTLLYPFTPPGGTSGSYRAKGTLINVSSDLWSGDDTMFGELWQTTKNVDATLPSSTQPAPTYTYSQYYFKFNESTESVNKDYKAAQAQDCNKMFSVKLDVEYLPSSSMPWKFAVTIDKNYRLINGCNFLIPVAGGAVLSKNGATVAQFDRPGRCIKLQNGIIVSNVTIAADIPGTLQPDGTYSPTILGAPTDCTAPAVQNTGTAITIVGNIFNSYVLRTKAGRLFGTIDIAGVIKYTDNSIVGIYKNEDSTVPIWSSNVLGKVFENTIIKPAIIGVVQNANDASAGGSISFGNSVLFPIAGSDQDYDLLNSTVYKYDLAKLQTDKAIAESKIACVKSSLIHYSVDFSTMIIACNKWKLYYDACDNRDNPKIVKPPAVSTPPKTVIEIKQLETEAIIATGAVKLNVNIKKESVITASLLRGSNLPMPGQAVSAIAITTINGATPSGSAIIESVVLNNHTVSITAKGLV